MAKGKLARPSSGQANKPKNKRNYTEISWYQCSGSSQIPSQDNLDDSQFFSLYRVVLNAKKTELNIYDIEKKKEAVVILDTNPILDGSTSITQLPNGELFCYGSLNSGITLIIDRNYRIRMLPTGTNCMDSSTLYFNNNVYCFGAYKTGQMNLSRKFDLKNNRWTNLAKLPEADSFCHSVIFNGNILISGYYSVNLWLYSIEIDSFSKIPYDFAQHKRKFMINVGRLYLVEWRFNGMIYESEDEYHWKLISNSTQLLSVGSQMYCLYNKGKIYISTWSNYYEFDLTKKVVSNLK